jgi:hypothetical protein
LATEIGRKTFKKAGLGPAREIEGEEGREAMGVSFSKFEK